MIRHKENIADIIGKNDRRSMYDSAVKTIFRNKQILSLLLHECVAEFQGASCQMIAEQCLVEPCGFSKGENRAPREGSALEVQTLDTEIPGAKGQQGQMDLCFYVKEPEYVPSRSWQMVDVEFQKAAKPGYSLLKRANYYVGSMMYIQYGRNFSNSDYNNILKSTSIWLCPSRGKSHARRYSMAVENLSGDDCDDGENYDMMRIVKIHFNPDAELHPNPVIGMLQTLFSRRLSIEEKLQLLKEKYSIILEKTEEMNNMIDLSDYYIELGIDEGRTAGRAEGMKKGIKKGRAEGIKKGRAEGIKKGRAEGIEKGRAEGLLEGISKNSTETTRRLLATLKGTVGTAARIAVAVSFVLAETVSLEDLKGLLTDEEYTIVTNRLKS